MVKLPPQRACKVARLTSRISSRAWVVWLAVLAAGVGSAPTARAHPELVPALVNRYLTLLPAGDRLAVQLSLLYGAVPAAERRRAMDGDGDGRIGPAEIEAEARKVKAHADQLFTVDIDGGNHERPWHEPGLEVKIDLGGDDRVGGAPLVVELTGALVLPPAQHRLDARFGPDLPRMGESEIVLAPGPPFRLFASAASGTDGGVETLGRDRVTFSTPRAAPDEPRGATFIVRADAPAQGDRFPIMPAALVLFATALGVVLTLVVRRSRRP